MRALLAVLSLLVGTAQANTYEVGTTGRQTSSNSLNLTLTWTVFGNLNSFTVWVPKLVSPPASLVWTQSGASGYLSVNPAAQITENAMGAWVRWEGVANTTLSITLTSSATAGLDLPGILVDCNRGGAGAWYRPTLRCQGEIPGLSATMELVFNTVVPGTDDSYWGAVERWVAWQQENITKSSGLSYSQTDAQTVYQNQVGNCAGFSNLFKAGLVTISPHFGVGIVLGATVVGVTAFPGLVTGGFTSTTSNGLHMWNVVWDGSHWVPVDSYHNQIGLTTLTRTSFGVWEDEADGNIIWSYQYTGSPPSISFSKIVNGSAGGGGTLIAKRERWPYPGQLIACHWYAAAHLKPDGDGTTTDAGPEVDPIIDATKRNTFVVAPNPASYGDRVEMQLFLERPAQLRLQIYNVRGQLIDTVTDGQRQAGYNYPTWTPPASLAEGTYLARVTIPATGQVLTQKFVLLR